jgi:hypothetical protein
VHDGYEVTSSPQHSLPSLVVRFHQAHDPIMIPTLIISKNSICTYNLLVLPSSEIAGC